MFVGRDRQGRACTGFPAPRNRPHDATPATASQFTVDGYTFNYFGAGHIIGT
jgi:hypothetical protein